MKTLTTIESECWCATRGIKLNAQQKSSPADTGFNRLRLKVPTEINKLTWFCRYVDAKLQPRNQCLLWVMSWGIWESSENWHTYYRLRQSYNDFRLLEEAPGHLFLEYESHDLVSFLQVGLIAGWDMHLFPSYGYGFIFISHDGWIEFAMKDDKELEIIAMELSIKKSA